MTELAPFLTPEKWLTQVFNCQAAARGGVVRRQVRDVERIVGRDRFLFEIDRRGFHLIENAGQYIILCNHDPVRVLR